LIGVALNFALV